MIRRIRLSKFRQHRSTSIELVPGVNTIVGLNNSGKSTIPEAIEFAMYGARALRDSAKGFITDGETDGSAVVEMDINDDLFVIGRNSRNAEVRKNGELDARYKDNVTTYVAHITGVNQTGFRLGHYVRQKELAAFSSLRPGKRFETVERMLKVNAVDKAIKRLKDEISELEITQKTLLGTYQDVEAIENELDDLRLAHESLTHRIHTLKNDLAVLSGLLTEQRKLQRELMKKPELLRLECELNDCALAEVELGTVESRLNDLGEVSQEAYKKLRDKASELREVERQSIAMRTRRDEIDSINPVKPPVVAPPDSTVLDRVKSDVMKLTVIVEAAETKVEEFKKLEQAAVCDRCHQSLSKETYTSILDDLLLDVNDLQTSLLTEQNRRDSLQSNYDEANAPYQEYLRAQQKYEQDCQRQEYLLKDYIEVNFDAEEQAQLDNELVAMQEARETWAKLNERRKSLVAVVDRRDELADRINKLAYLKKLDDDPALDTTIDENEHMEHDLNDMLNKAVSELAHTEGRTAELNRLVAMMRQTRESIDNNYHAIAKLKAMRDNFVLFKRHLTAKIRPMLEQVAEALFHKTTKDRYAAYNLSSDYEITLTTHSGYIRKLSTISGSENDLACLCLRLAIATLRSTKLAGSLGFIILDEISGSFDDDRTRQTLEGLLELRDVIPQIINITHKDVEMKYADKLFTVKEINGIAQVTS